MAFLDVQRELEAHKETSKLHRWKKNVYYRGRDGVAFSMEEQQYCILHRERSVSVWVEGRARWAESQLPVLG